MITLDSIYRASFALKDIIRRTDLIYAPQINPESQIYLKPENLQYTGSFKLRGACYKIACLTEEEKKKGVIACSAGNHAQGVALGATKNGIDSLICLPAGAPISKVEATKRYGAKVCLVPGVYDDAYQKALELKEEKGYTFIHPFDDEYVIAGQGTIGLELLNQLPDVEAVIVPIGGGGLISGVAYALKSLKPDVKVYGVQAQGAASMLRSIEKAHRECLPSVSTVADGIAVKEPGEHTFEMNIDVTILSRVINRGLDMSGRTYTVTLDLHDKPGELKGVAEIIANLGGNIISVLHERNNNTSNVTACFLRLMQSISS